jgi:aminoglycoside/choline kinase family phosphotransferase
MIKINSDTDNDTRLSLLEQWLTQQWPGLRFHLKLLAGDCSLRRYFRVTVENQTFIAMDAPPDHEPCAAFVAIAEVFHQAKISVPVIYAKDLDKGFLLLSDFGNTLLSNILQANNVDSYYQKAFAVILQIQQSSFNKALYTPPAFDTALYKHELNLCKEWYLENLLQAELSKTELQALEQTFECLITAALAQPQVLVHRDFHCRNIMILPNNELGILDFQDAVYGPITYDLVSLLRDCYIDWPLEQTQQWVFSFQQLLLQSGLIHEDRPQEFMRWFDWIGLQRHLKCLGIFSRMNLRYHKPEYLRYLPRVLNYIKTVTEKYPEFSDLEKILAKARGLA